MDIFFEPQVPHVSAEEVKRAMDATESFVLLDVRTPGEFARGKISGSINMPVDTVTCDILTAVPDKTTKIYVYCLSGSRSVHAVDALLKVGYSNVYDMEHGLLAWRAKYFPTES